MSQSFWGCLSKMAKNRSTGGPCPVSDRKQAVIGHNHPRLRLQACRVYPRSDALALDISALHLPDAHFALWFSRMGDVVVLLQISHIVIRCDCSVCVVTKCFVFRQPVEYRRQHQSSLIECDVRISQAALKFRMTVSEGISNFVNHPVCYT
jgi:hypothetical protein